MRVTGQMLAATVTRNLSRLRERLAGEQTQLATGMRVARPSEGPSRVLEGMKVNSALAELDQLEANLADGKGWLTSSESALNHLIDRLDRARELAVRGSNGALPQDALDALALEVEAIAGELLGVVNESHAGNRLFGGHKVDAPPFAEAGGVVTYGGNGAAVEREMAPGMRMQVNLTGQDLLAAVDFFAALKQMAADLKSGDLTAVSGARTVEMDQALSHLISLRSLVGVRLSRIEHLETRALESRVNLSALLSQAQGIDLERLVIEVGVTEMAYQTALQIGSRIIPASLVDFLR